MIRRAQRLGAVVAAVVVVGLVGASPACRTATQVTVELRTFGDLKCSALEGVAIVVSSSAVEAENKLGADNLSAQVTRGECGPDDHSLGSLVVTPSDSTGAIVVRASLTDAKCIGPAYKGCIIARRTFSFIDHAALVLPITLEAACIDVPCDVLTSCRTGACIASTTECSESTGMCESGAQPVLAPDGGVVPPPADAMIPDGPGLDGSMTDGPVVVDASEDSADGAMMDGSAPPPKTNNCPTMAGPVDCAAANGGAEPVCCRIYNNQYLCKTNAGCDAVMPMLPRFSCVGPLHCLGANAVCCHLPAAGPETSVCAPACVDRVLCGTDADCQGKACSGILPMSTVVNGGSLHFCEPYP